MKSLQNPYSLPKPHKIEEYLFVQEVYLTEGLKRKFIPRSQRTDGFSFLKQDAEWLKLFWRVYMHAPREDEKPSLFLAHHHFATLNEFIQNPLQRSQALEVAENLSAKLRSKDIIAPTEEDYRLFAKTKPDYYARRKLREEFNPLTKVNWIAGRR
ncbi:MAG: hypothetical protein Q7R87_03075 [Nanoarchaeota archaeon]|nr:hypothetical protein [Nanoarchaeota archaeon]